jgi:predicted O-methyltransferase YrrM
MFPAIDADFWRESVSQDKWTAVDDYFTDLLVKPDAALERTLARSAEAGLPSISVAPNQGKLLHLIARIRNARRILEIGTLAGYSTIWLSRALPADGALVSLEANATHANIARANIDDAGLSSIVSIVVGKAVDSLAKLIADATEAFDLIFIDADKESNPDYLRLSLQLSKAGTLIIGDNVVRNGRVADANNKDTDVEGVRQFLALLAGDSCLSTTAVQTVGSKGWDGFSLTIVGE